MQFVAYSSTMPLAARTVLIAIYKAWVHYEVHVEYVCMAKLGREEGEKEREAESNSYSEHEE